MKNARLPVCHASAIPSRTYPFSSDQGSQTELGLTSTRLSDCPGTSSADVFAALPHNHAFGAGSKAPAGLLELKQAHADHGTTLDLEICTLPPACSRVTPQPCCTVQERSYHVVEPFTAVAVLMQLHLAACLHLPMPERVNKQHSLESSLETEV